MRFKRICLLFFILFVFSCKNRTSNQSIVKVNDIPSNAASVRSSINSKLKEVNEQLLGKQEMDFFRMGLTYSGYQQKLVFGVTDIGNSYLLYSKTQYPPDFTHFDCKGELILKDSCSSFNIAKLIELSNGLTPIIPSDSGTVINDGGGWFVEYRLDSVYVFKDGNLVENIDTLRSLFGMKPFEIQDFGENLVD